MRPNQGLGLRGPGSKDLPSNLTDLADPVLNWGNSYEARRHLDQEWAALGLFDTYESQED